MKIGVVVQGGMSNFYMLQKNISMLKSFFPAEDIVVSTWKNHKILEDLGVHVIKTDQKIFKKCHHFNIVNKNNRIYQIWSTSYGISHLIDSTKEYDYIIKIRTDEWFEKYDVIIDRMQADSRIHSASAFFRTDFPFHVGDHLLGGPTEAMIDFYRHNMNSCLGSMDGVSLAESSLSGSYQKAIVPKGCGVDGVFKWTPISTPPETYFTINYLNGIGNDVELTDHKPLLNKYFSPLPLEILGDFYISTNSLGLNISHKTLDKLEEAIFTDEELICDDCHPDFLCDSRRHQALLLALVRNMAKEDKDIVELTDGFQIYNSLRRPWANIKDLTWEIEL